MPTIKQLAADVVSAAEAVDVAVDALRAAIGTLSSAQNEAWKAVRGPNVGENMHRRGVDYALRLLDVPADPAQRPADTRRTVAEVMTAAWAEYL